ncbi:MAG TPA: CpsD/CapB family tyrosine-protein kinase [Syntrophorhabdus sp.]|nr:CpsD/CapB family tyrosine-protein kinase [Syntrophorhabdus sp.]
MAAEAFRSLRTAILFSFPENPPKSFVVTSFMPQEGKSFIAANTALIMASAGDRVLLIDADLRRPMIHKLLKVDNEKGLTNMIVGGGGARPLDLSERLSVIPSGPIPPNPSELLGSQNFLELMEGLKWEYDKVVIDAPPINSVTDALVVSRSLESGVIFVIKAGVTTKEMVRDAKGMLDGINARILGGVLNNVRMNSSGYYHYSSYHYYHKYYGDEDKANGDGKKKRGLWAVTKAVTAAGMGRKTVD